MGKEGIRTIRGRPEGEQWSSAELFAVKGTVLQPNPGSGDMKIRTKMDPGVAVPEIIGDPVTKEDVAKELGAERPFYLLRANVR